MSYSKYFYQALEGCTCADILHSTTPNCWEALLWSFITPIPGCCQFVLPIAMLPIVMQIKNLNVEVLKKSFKYFLEYVAATLLTSGLSHTLVCIFFHLFKKIHFYTALALPSCVGGFISCFILSDKITNLFGRGLFLLCVEVFIRYNESFQNSKMALTLTFMALNMAILHALRQINSDILWFYQPYKRRKQIEKPNIPSAIMDRVMPTDMHICEHKISCDSYIFQGIYSYLKIGLGIEIGRKFCEEIIIVRAKPFTFLATLPGKINMNLVRFLVGYVAIYRISNCILNRYNKKNSSKNHLCSSFLAGSSYLCYPDLSLLAHAATSAIELTWKNYVDTNSSLPPVAKFINNLPIAKIVYPIAFGYLLHIRCFFPWLAPDMLKKFLRLLTMKDTEVLTQYYSRLLGTSDLYTLYLFGLSDKY